MRQKIFAMITFLLFVHFLSIVPLVLLDLLELSLIFLNTPIFHFSDLQTPWAMHQFALVPTDLPPIAFYLSRKVAGWATSISVVCWPGKHDIFDCQDGWVAFRPSSKNRDNFCVISDPVTLRTFFTEEWGRSIFCLDFIHAMNRAKQVAYKTSAILTIPHWSWYMLILVVLTNDETKDAEIINNIPCPTGRD